MPSASTIVAFALATIALSLLPGPRVLWSRASPATGSLGRRGGENGSLPRAASWSSSGEHGNRSAAPRAVGWPKYARSVQNQQAAAPDAEWNRRIDGFWAEADDTRPDDMWTALNPLLAERPSGDAAALFERASLHDMLGEELEAIPLYRDAIQAGLDDERAGYAAIQLGSSLRNVGDFDEALAELEPLCDDERLGAAARAFIALTLHDLGRHTDALRIVMTDHAPNVPIYGRALGEYAGLLGSSSIPHQSR